MFQTARGVSLPFPEQMQEQYRLTAHCAEIVLSFEKIRPMLLDFISRAEEPFFLALELPVSQDEESALRTCDTDPFHKKVCYLDGQSRQEILDLLSKYGELLLHDGISQFAVASHVTQDDFYIQKYKVICLYSDPPTKYVDLLQAYGLRETDHLLTPWDTFSPAHPGSVQRITVDGRNIFDLYEELVQLGLYVAKTEAE